MSGERHLIDFRVAGTNYVSWTPQLKDRLVSGAVLKPLHDPRYPNSLALYLFGDLIGYVPNKGKSCSACRPMSPVGSRDKACRKCGAGAFHFVEGGLAFRLTKRDANSKECYAVVTGVYWPEDLNYPEITAVFVLPE